MKRGRSMLRRLAVLSLVVGMGAGVTACTQQEEDPGGLPPFTGVSPDPNDVPPDDTDYSVDAGNNMPDYEYEEEPAPADTVVATLCNLNQKFFSGLRTVRGGEPVVDDGLRTNLVGLADLIDDWESLRRYVPEAEADLDLAGEIHENWDLAVLRNDDGDERAARSAMAEAERLLKKLPENPSDYCIPSL